MKLHLSFMKQTQWLWAFLILPIINISALFFCDPINENITHIAYANKKLPFVILWASTCAYYFWCSGYRLIEELHTHKKSCRYLLTAICLLMVVSILIPYDNQTSMLSKLHVRTAMSSTVAYIILLLYILCQLSCKHLAVKKLLNTYVSFISTLCLLFILTGCVSAIIEVSFVIFMGVFLYVLLNNENYLL